ncbi:MAG: hypothetical protein U1E59_07085 [Amaricoccus sp.]
MSEIAVTTSPGLKAPASSASRRLAKRDDARSLATLRAEGAKPGMLRELLGLDRA